MPTLERVKVEIERNVNTKIPRDIFAYELPVLREIHGDDLVHEIETRDVKVEKFDAQEAYDTLIRKYQSSAESMACLRRIYPNAGVLQRAVIGNGKPQKQAPAE